ncbi:gamma-glutamyl-gamma-aminobutyrate hydrolase family protein, partial [Paraburkholderia sp. Se-20369]|nr:gamma-glutamyl-gamma-aminobutyrate hydrolase family protein [Paraburkholderia sp. Se-20369]
LGVQWRPEWRFAEQPLSRDIFAAFGAACRARMTHRIRAAVDGEVAPPAAHDVD